jgi:hypothetical protein
MNASGRNVGSLVRAGNLLGVLFGHAVVGGVCLVRGRIGFEALRGTWPHWGFLIMLAGAVIVMTELAFRPGRNAGAERAWHTLGLLFVLSNCAGVAWFLAGETDSAYDVLASILSQGIGADIDVESGAGFAGIPWLALCYAGALVGYCVAVDECLKGLLEARPLRPRLLLRGTAAARMLVLLLGLVAVGGVLHLATGTRLFVAKPGSGGSHPMSLV